MPASTEPQETEIHQAEIDGVPTFWALGPPPLTAAMMFRVGRADETFATGGITHLVEHLAMFSLEPLAMMRNAFVDVVRTVFHARGDRQDVSRFLRETAQALHRLPIARLESERRVLITEAVGRSRNPVAALMAALFGAKGPGLADYRELGLLSLPGEALEAWAAERFTRDNCAIWMTGPPPEDLALGLPSGSRFPSPPIDPIPGITFPAVKGDAFAGVALGYLCAHTSADKHAGDLAAMSLTERLRRQDALIYDLQYSYMALSSTSAHVAFAAASLESNVDAVREAMLENLAEFRDQGPPADVTEQRLSMIRQLLDDPSWMLSSLDTAALAELMGMPQLSYRTYFEQQSEVTPQESAAALSSGLDQAILIVPLGSARPDGFTMHLGRADHAVNGRTYARWPDLDADLPKGAAPPSAERLILGAKGISRVWEGGRGWTTTVRFANCVGILMTPAGGLMIQGDNERSIEVMTAELREGEDFMSRLRTAVSADLFLRSDHQVGRWLAMDALAHERFGSRTSAWLDLQALAGRLEADERVEELAMGGRDGQAGIIALTDRRLVWARHPRGAPTDRWVGFPRGDIAKARTSRRGFGLVLTVARRGQPDVAFRSVTPTSSATAIVSALTSNQAEPRPS